METGLVLGVETSCDETAAAVVDGRLRVLSSVVASQDDLHRPFGGVVPEIASRRHLEAIIPVMEQALSDAGVGPEVLAGVAVTYGPGLIGALLVGLQAAKGFAWAHDLPLVGVNHLHGHLLAVGLCCDEADRERPRPALPYVALLVSGGHTATYRINNWCDVELIGDTRDDAAGEAIDKFARMAGLGYPGGPVVDRLAEGGDPQAYQFPRALRSEGHDFSFSGLKTAVRLHLQRHGVPEAGSELSDLCASVQEAVADVLVHKALRACEATQVPRLVLGGGVAANRRLRALCLERGSPLGIQVFLPPRSLCTDNAAMIAGAGVRLLAEARRGADFPGGLDLNASASLPVEA